MINRSNLPVIYEERKFADGFRASCEYYTQFYQAENSLHYHNCLELGYCLSGNGVQFIDGDVFSFTPNTVSIVQKSCIHDSHIIMPTPNETPSEWRYIFVDLDALNMTSPTRQSYISSDKNLVMLYEMMFSELETHPDGWQEQFSQLLLSFLRFSKRLEPARHIMHPSSAAERIASTLHLIALEYANDLTIEQLAQRSNMSVSYFRKVFSESVGMNPQQYIIHVRLSMAEHLLRTTNKSILEISQDVGFRSISSFNRLFLRAYGCSPRQFRR